MLSPVPLTASENSPKGFGWLLSKERSRGNSDRLWKLELGDFLPNCVCMLTVSGERHSSKLGLFKDFTVLEGIHQDSRSLLGSLSQQVTDLESLFPFKMSSQREVTITLDWFLLLRGDLGAPTLKRCFFFACCLGRLPFFFSSWWALTLPIYANNAV